MPTTTDRRPWVLGIGRVDGTEIQVSASCLIIVALLAVAFAPRAEDLVPGLGAGALLVGVGVGILVYAAALIHELAHAAVARHHHHPVPWIRLALAGGRTHVGGRSRTPGEEALTAAAGPAVSLLIGLAALGLRLAVEDGVPALVLEALVLANLLIALIDLIPALPLDGGRLVTAAAWRVLGSRARGTLAAARFGQGVAVALVLVPVLVAPVAGVEPSVSLWAVCGGVAILVWAAAGDAARRARAELDDLAVDSA